MPTTIRKVRNSIIRMITSWSFSRLSDWQDCPAKAKYKHVDKIKEPSNKYSDKGNEVHKAGEDFIKGKTKAMSPDFKNFKKPMDDLRKNKALAEQEWAFDTNWNKVGWFDARAWLRIKMDAHYVTSEKVKSGKVTINQTVVKVVDYKTGKIKLDEHRKQRTLYALGAMLVYPDAAKVVVQHWYLEHGEEHEDVFFAADLDELKEYWLKETKPMLNDKRFAPRPGHGCQWCFFSKGKNGPCKF